MLLTTFGFSFKADGMLRLLRLLVIYLSSFHYTKAKRQHWFLTSQHFFSRPFVSINFSVVSFPLQELTAFGSSNSLSIKTWTILLKSPNLACFCQMLAILGGQKANSHSQCWVLINLALLWVYEEGAGQFGRYLKEGVTGWDPRARWGLALCQTHSLLTLALGAKNCTEKTAMA